MFCRKNKSRSWEKKQVRPYPGGASSWKGNVFAVQCFYGFASLDDPSAETSHDVFGSYLPDDAVVAVREWLDTVKFMKTAQVRTVLLYMCLKLICNIAYHLHPICSMAVNRAVDMFRWLVSETCVTEDFGLQADINPRSGSGSSLTQSGNGQTASKTTTRKSRLSRSSSALQLTSN